MYFCKNTWYNEKNHTHISLMLFTLGYTIWDRRTALIPVQKTTISLKEKVKNIENILIKEAATNTRFAEILRTYGLM